MFCPSPPGEGRHDPLSFSDILRSIMKYFQLLLCDLYAILTTAKSECAASYGASHSTSH
nr:MAG TPA: hypothetical protein [Caudoviricetes sp.]